MKKNYTDKVNRKAFIQLCLENPEKGAEHIQCMVDSLKTSKNTTEIVLNLKQILFISECTIFRDLKN